MTQIAMLCPTYGRPDKCKSMIKSIADTAYDKSSISVFLGLTDGDKEEQAYLDMARSGAAQCGVNIYIYSFPDWTVPMCQNVLYENALGFDIYFHIGDDALFSTPGWDKALRDSYDGLSNKIHAWSLRDSRDENGTPHPIVSSAYAKVLGYVVPPVFIHWHTDVYTVEIAKANNCFTHLKDYLLIHDKMNDSGITDGTFARNRNSGWGDRDSNFLKTCSHFFDCEKQRLAEALK